VCLEVDDETFINGPAWPSVVGCLAFLLDALLDATSRATKASVKNGALVRIRRALRSVRVLMNMKFISSD
jgi:hypothetical protein